MGRFICLHYSSNNDRKEIWINTDAIVAVIDERPMHGWTRIGIYTDPEGYCVEETVESVIGLIEQKTNPLDNYVCPVPSSVNLAKARAEEKKNEQN